jgi:hypothetical protein
MILVKNWSIKMASILEELQDEKQIEYVKISIKISSDLKNKIDFIEKKSGVSSADYLAKLLEKSEINKVYSMLVSAEKKAKKEQDVPQNIGQFNVNGGIIE